jgi:hypothetical protein
MSSSKKRHRAAGSEGHGSPSLPPTPDTFFASFIRGMKSSGPPERAEELACPFVKHNPEAYKHVRNSCTTSGFSSISTLREHIRRVHLLKYSCRRCNNRFTGPDAKFARWKQDHECRANRKPRQRPEVELMTEQQDEDFLGLEFRSTGLTSGEAFERIYLKLWPETPEADIPDGYFWPGFLFSLPQIQAELGKIERSLGIRAIPDTSFVPPLLPGPTPTLPLSTPCIQGLPFHNTPPVPEFDQYAGTWFNRSESVPYLIRSNCIQRNTESRATALPLSFQNLSTQVCPDPPFHYTVPQVNSSLDSGFYSREPSETDPACPLAPATATSSQGAMKPESLASATAAFNQEVMNYNLYLLPNTSLHPTAESTNPIFYSPDLLIEDDDDVGI